MVIKSNTLNAIANKLNDQGVKNLKGPDFAGSRFHVTLPKEIISKSDAKQYAKNLSTNEWFLTIAKRKEPACQWKHHMPLHKCAC